MTDEEKTICEDCQNGDHCNDEGDEDCDCDCTYEDDKSDSDLGDDGETIDEIDEGYEPESEQDLANDHLSERKVSISKMIKSMILVSALIIGIAYLVDNNILVVFDSPINHIINPDNPIVKETTNDNPDLLVNFIDGCNLQLVKINGKVTGGNLVCSPPPTVEQVEKARAKFAEIYG